jgi:hypothetical protein
VVRYVEIVEQPTVLDTSASDVANILRAAHFRVALIRDMDSWLQRHAVFVTAVSGALYKLDVSSKRLSSDSQAVRNLIVAIRQGWAAMDRRRIAPAPVTLRAIFEWVPMPFAVLYWRRLFGSTRGEYYFERHARHAVKEMAALAGDVRTLLSNEPIPQLQELFAAIDRAVATTP